MPDIYRTTWDGQPITPEPPFGAAIVVFRDPPEGRRYLILHRAHKGPDAEGNWAWGPPSGARHPGEPLAACVRRELIEETGFDLFCRKTAFGDRRWAVYLAKAPPDAQVVLSPEHDRFLWLPAEEASLRSRPAKVGKHILDVHRFLVQAELSSLSAGTLEEAEPDSG